jgi:hypothetical protein
VATGQSRVYYDYYYGRDITSRILENFTDTLIALSIIMEKSKDEISFIVALDEDPIAESQLGSTAT